MSFFSWGPSGNPAPAPAAAAAAAGADADADADAGPKSRPAPLDLGEKPVDDADRWNRSRARWNLSIQPEDPGFVAQLAVFETALDPGSGKSIDETLRDHFSNYEVHKFSGWADRKREPDLYRQQKRDAEAYNALLATPPWDKAAPQAFLAFKMTMLFFGFSVEPMKMNDYFKLPPGSGLFGLDDDGDSDIDDQRTFVPEEMRPLRFLNRYGKRSYGADNGHMMPDPSFEMYYGLPFQPQEAQQPGHGGPAATVAQAGMRIRGRGLGEDDYDDDDDDDESMSDSSVDGASFCSDSLLPDAPDVDLGGEGEGGRALKLRGGAGGPDSEASVWITSFSGSVSCPALHAGDFYAAIDTVLVLEERLGVHITVALLREKQHNNYVEVVQLERVSLGNESSEKDVHDRLLKAYTRAWQDSTEERLRFFVCHRSGEPALLQLRGKGGNTGTNCLPALGPENFQFSRSELDGRVNLAYLWLPQGVKEDIASNLYAEWFRTVVRILSGPQDPGGKLGRHSAQLPEVPFWVNVDVKGAETPFHRDSPLPREAWEAIVRTGRGPSASNPPANHFTVTLTSISETAFVQVPGYHPAQPTAGPNVGVEDVFRLAWSSVPEHDKNSVASMVVRRPSHPDTVTFQCRNGRVDHRSAGYRAAEGRLRDWLNRKYFLTVVPQWATYQAIITGTSDQVPLPGHWEWSDIRSRILAALSRAGPANLEETHVLHIDQRTAQGQEATRPLQKNRAVWDLGLGNDERADADWSEFRAALSVREFTIAVVPKHLGHGKGSIVNPLASDGQGALWDQWGCNRPPPAHDPAQGHENDHVQEHDHDHVIDHDHVDVLDHDHGHGQGQGQGQGLLHQGVPQLGAGVDMFQSGKYYREQSFATPLSVQVGDQKPRFPINAPPIEHIRRPRGPGGIESDSMPIVSTQIMTPTEQRTLQQAFFQMRSIALNRAQQCPHKGCSAFFPVDPDNMAAFHKHLADKHIGSHCPFCDETLFQHWSASDKQKHFVDNHSEYFTAKGDLLQEALLAARTKCKGNVHPREEQYNFCPRCGRNHQLLSSKADRVHHDNACFPGNEATLQTEQYCLRCGVPDSGMVGLGSTGRRQKHQCAATDPSRPASASDTFCQHCALDCHQLPVSYGRRHLLNCKALASGPDNWCPWCGIDLKSGPRASRLKHLAICVLKPASGQNPVCTDSGIPLDSPRDVQAHRLRHGLTDMGTVDRKTRIAVPPTCPVGGCGADLTSWNAQGLYDHFRSHPENSLEAGGGLKSCPFCKCNFETRGWTTSLEKQQHFDDHIHFKQRARRVLNDEIIGSHSDRQSAPVLQAISTLDYDPSDNTARTENLNAEIARLSETVKRLAEENRKCKDAQRESSGKQSTQPITPPSLGVKGRAASRASRHSPAGEEPPAKRHRSAHHGPSTTTIPGFSTGRQVFRRVQDAGEDWDEEEDDEEEESTLGSDEDVEDEIIDDEDLDDDLEGDDDDELVDEV